MFETVLCLKYFDNFRDLNPESYQNIWGTIRFHRLPLPLSGNFQQITNWWKFSYFFQKIGIVKAGENKQNISKCHLLIFLPRVSNVNSIFCWTFGLYACHLDRWVVPNYRQEDNFNDIFCQFCCKTCCGYSLKWFQREPTTCFAAKKTPLKLSLNRLTISLDKSGIRWGGSRLIFFLSGGHMLRVFIRSALPRRF